MTVCTVPGTVGYCMAWRFPGATSMQRTHCCPPLDLLPELTPPRGRSVERDSSGVGEVGPLEQDPRAVTKVVAPGIKPEASRTRSSLG